MAPDVFLRTTTPWGEPKVAFRMAGIAQDKSIEESIVFANHAAALSVTKFGVIESIPTLEEVEAFIKEVSK